MKKYLIYIILALLLISCSKSSDPDKKETELSLTSSQTTLAVGDTQTISINVSEAENVFLINMEILYDDALIELDKTSLIAGNFWVGDVINFVETENGKCSILIGLTQTEEIDGLNGSGKVLDLDFSALATGACEVSINNLSILDEAGNEIYNQQLINESSLMINIE